MIRTYITYYIFVKYGRLASNSQPSNPNPCVSRLQHTINKCYSKYTHEIYLHVKLGAVLSPSWTTKARQYVGCFVDSRLGTNRGIFPFPQSWSCAISKSCPFNHGISANSVMSSTFLSSCKKNAAQASLTWNLVLFDHKLTCKSPHSPTHPNTQSIWQSCAFLLRRKVTIE